MLNNKLCYKEGNSFICTTDPYALNISRLTALLQPLILIIPDLQQKLKFAETAKVACVLH